MSDHRVKCTELLDAEIRPHNERFRAAAGIRPGERVLDVGCGTGQSTCEAGVAASPGGSAFGVDVSEPAIEYARERAASEGLDNVGFEVADAAAYPFPAEHFDVCVSRFGSMFFADPAAAFGNIASALRPGARLVLLVWQDQEHNPWSTEVHEALVPGTAAPSGGPFSLGDPAVVRELLTTAGFGSVAFADVPDPVYYGPDAGTAFELVSGFQAVEQTLAGLGPDDAQAARQRLRDLLAAHRSGDGVYFGARAWIVTARRD